MTKSEMLLCSFVIILSTLASVGCGGSYTPPVAGLKATSHPLVAQYTIPVSRQGTTAWVEFGTDTNYGRTTSVQTNNASDLVNILVAGMKPKTTYHLRAHAAWAGGSWVDQDQTFTTGALPSSILPPTFSIAPPAPDLPVTAAPAPGVELLSLFATGGLGAAATDLEGNLIWYCPSSAAFPIKLMQNGHFIINLGEDLQEVDLACNTIRDVSTAEVNQSLQANGYSFMIPANLGIPGGSPFHHDVLVLPNGHWITLCQIAKTFSDLPGYSGTTNVVGDAVVDIDTNGNVGWAWSSFDHLDVNRHPYFGLPDWTHSNALVYTADGNLLVSMRHQSWILKIDYHDGSGSGDVLWKLGPDGDFTIEGGDPSQWFYSQHYPAVLSTSGSQTTLGVFDNGNFRPDATGIACQTTPTAPACYSRATIFLVDESTNLATLLWQDLPGYFSFWGGNVGVLSDNDVEFAMSEPTGGTSSQIMEVTQSASPQIVWQMNIDGANAYRGYRIPSLYPGVTWPR